MFFAITRQTIKAAAAIFALGLLCGASGTVLFNMDIVDQLYLEREMLLSELSESQVRIGMLEQSLTERRTRVVRAVSIQLNTGDQHLNLKLAHHARQLIDGLIGQEVSSIDPTLVAAVFQKRIVRIDQGQFELDLEYLIISDTITVNLTVRPLQGRTGN
ncbi:MAG: hypothetical protein GX195_10810 [Firmicutes bacterium]|jgi:hypothetical protein|nr:hypothetical protein [Bacillota bacterium]